jgi:hypothetical protein
MSSLPLVIARRRVPADWKADITFVREDGEVISSSTDSFLYLGVLERGPAETGGAGALLDGGRRDEADDSEA